MASKARRDGRNRFNMPWAVSRLVQVQMPVEVLRTIPVGLPATMSAALVLGSSVYGGTVNLPLCKPNLDLGMRGFHTNVSDFEFAGIKAFQNEMCCKSFARTLRTAILIGLGTPYCRDGVVNTFPLLSRAYAETLVCLAGRCNAEVYHRVGRGMYAALWQVYCKEGSDGLALRVQRMLDYYTPRHLIGIERILRWYAEYENDERKLSHSTHPTSIDRVA